MYANHRRGLLDAAATANEAAIRRCMAEGADPFARDPSRRDSFDYLIANRALYLIDTEYSHSRKSLAHFGDKALPPRLKCFKVLLSYGVDLRRADKYGWTLLHRTAWGGDLPATQLLLSHGAETNVYETQGRTPSDLAAIKGYIDVANCLDTAGSSLLSLCRQTVRKALGKQFATKLDKLPLSKSVKLFLNFGAPYLGWSANFEPTRPWTTEELSAKKVSHEELSMFLQNHATASFLSRHSLVGKEDNDAKKTSKEIDYSCLVEGFQQLFIEKDFKPVTFEDQKWVFRTKRPVDLLARGD